MKRDMLADAPDTFGLPEYRITKIIKQRKGDELHMLCGSETFGQIHWWFVCVMKASDVIVESRDCEVQALDAILELKMATKTH